MDFNVFLEEQGWDPVPRQKWIAVKDHRPEFRAAFHTDRIGKIVGTVFYVTLTQLADATQCLVRQSRREPVSITSTATARDVTYWGLDTAGMTDEEVKIFFRSLSKAIGDRL